jgi:hypothetical protein
MKAGTDDKRKRLLAMVLGGVALLAVSYTLYNTFSDGTPAPVQVQPVIADAPTAGNPVAVAGPAAKKIGTTSAQLDPTLHMEGMLVAESLVYAGFGRNIFSPVSAEPPPMEIAVNKFPPRPEPPKPPQPPQPPQKPPLPPINLKFFGTSTSKSGDRKAFLLNGDDVFIAAAGDIVQRRYRIISIAANSVLVEDIPNSNKQTLPLISN